MTTRILLVLDGWGYNPSPKYNAILGADTPNYSYILQNYPHSLIETSGLDVGLPEGQMGNSEVGHMTIGSGRVMFQDLPKINHAIESKQLEDNEALKELIATLKENGGTCHIIGLISDGGVHSHIDHIVALNKILRKHNIKVLIHAITDGRDTPPKCAQGYINFITQAGLEIASISGRFYAMDRDKRWDRIELSYNAIIKAQAPKFNTPQEVIEQSYTQDISDEFIIPHVENNYQGIKENDAILMANFRADRVRQILTALVEEDFKDFPRGNKAKLASVVGMTEYSEELNRNLSTLFPAENITYTLGEVISKHGMRQLRIAETEKYAHVTFFLSGGREEPFEGEERILVPSPKVKTYDLAPQMSVYDVTDKLIEAIKSRSYNLICVNFANADMVGHSGNIEATVKAIEAIDDCLGKILTAIKETDSEMLITADHGNAELMKNPDTLEPFTSHTLFKVPLIYIGEKNIKLKDGALSDIAPTLLELIDIRKPKEMTGNSLITFLP